MDEEDTEDYSPLLKAVRNGHLDEVKSLVSQGADVNQGNAEGWTPLVIAAKTGRVEILMFLIDQGADVRKYVKGKTAFDFAAQFGHLDVIDQGAEVDTRNNNGLTALHNAAKNDHLDVVKYLISEGAKVNEGNYDDETPLYFAAHNGHLDVVKYLISEGAEIFEQALKPNISLKKPPFDIGSSIFFEDRIESLEEADHYQDACTGSTKTERHEESRKQSLLKQRREDFTTPQDDPKLEKEQSAGKNESQTQATDREEDHTDAEECDLIQLEKHGITVRISKYEIYSAKETTVEVIEDVPPELELKETEAIISVGLKMSPSDADFNSPVRVTMPHCGVFTKPKDAEVYIYYRKNGSTSYC
nr:ankyrin repeat domain-containing protein 17-like [Lytechinus pictus]